MRSWLTSILLVLVSVPLMAQTASKPQTTTTTTTKTTTTKTKKPMAKRPMAKPTRASELKTLQDAVSAQQQQIQMLRDELARRDAALQQVQQQVNSLQSTAQQAQSTAQAAESSSKQNEDALASLKTNVGTVTTTATATATSLQETDKKVKALESPVAIKYKGITITPGGFISANVNWRQHNQNLDNFGSFGAIPFAGSSQGHLTEFRETARYSRISLFAQGKTKTFSVQGYYEMDFEGGAQTANEGQTNSFQPRIREAWANVDAPHGVSFTGGQTWSLLTANRTGVGPRGLALPAGINASIMVGFHYARQNGFRVYKKWEMSDKKKLYLAFAVENPEATTSGSIPAGLTIWGTQARPVVSPGGAANCAADRTVSGLAPCSNFATNLSVDAAPDVIGKLAVEPGWGHFEIAAVARFFRDRIAPTTAVGIASAGANHTTPGGGVSFNGILPVAPKKVDLTFSSLVGRGIGRYGTTGMPDTVYRSNGQLQPVMGYQFHFGLETHPSPKLDVHVYFGDEYTRRTTYYTGGTALLPTGTGYGLISQDLRGCNEEIPVTGDGCSASNKNVYEIMPGFWYRFYRGPAGTVQFGAFFEHYYRSTWAGKQTATGANPLPVSTSQNEILTAFRWYFP